MEWPAGERAVLHVDMDAFYASVEQRDRPELRGLPVVVGGPKDARGVVSAASYEARAFGVRSAMPLRTAARLCPRAVFVPVRMDRYLEVSRGVFAILDRFSPLVEALSVDEAFLDLTGCERLLGGPVAAARAIRDAVRAECGLTCSVGVAPNKFVAKIASDLEKPDALVVVPPGAVTAFLAPLPVERMWGVGPRGGGTLRAIGIRTFADLAAADPARLRRAVGAHAGALAALARGSDARPVVPDSSRKSVGAETTFPEDVSDPDALRETLVLLADRVGTRLRRDGLDARCVTLKVRYAPFRTITRRATLEAPASSTGALLGAAWRLFRERTPGAREPVRLLGIAASDFLAQPLLFAPREEARARRVDDAVDAVRRRFGTAALGRGSVVASGAVGRAKRGSGSGGARRAPSGASPEPPCPRNASSSSSVSSAPSRASSPFSSSCSVPSGGPTCRASRRPSSASSRSRPRRWSAAERAARSAGR